MKLRTALLVALVLSQAFSMRPVGAAQPAAQPAAQSAAPSSPEAQVRIGVARPGGGYTVATIPLETYVARVLVGEAARDSQPAALEALAIAVRTFTLANRGRHGAEGFDLCDQTHCQVMRTATAATVRAASVTAGRALLSDGMPASIYYSASCGGRTEVPSAVWPGAKDPSYMPSQPDDACEGTPVWEAQLDSRDMLAAFRAAGFRGERLRDMRIASRTTSGRVGRLRLDGLTPEFISGQDLRMVIGRSIGWQHIKSTAFDLKRDGDSYRFSGHGSGHGVGMCVIGSTRLAVAGRSATEILQRYFPGLVIGVPADIATLSVDASQSARPAVSPPAMPSMASVAPREAAAVPGPAARPAASPAMNPEVLVSLPEADRAESAAIAELTGRARDTMARALGVPAPRVRLRFHPTAESYQQATREPWFTLAAIVNGEIHLLPLATLRGRGVLDRTIRHELVHLMTNAALAERPQWVREGVAIHFAAEPPSPGQPAAVLVALPRNSCPDDRELLRPVSVGGLTNAYARAESCFERQLIQRNSWREVK